MGYPMLYSTYLCISGYCGHCSSLSLHPARPIWINPGGKLLYFHHVWLHLLCYPLTAGHQVTVGSLLRFWRGKPYLGGLSVADTEDHLESVQTRIRKSQALASTNAEPQNKQWISLTCSNQIWNIPKTKKKYLWSKNIFGMSRVLPAITKDIPGIS